jgi:hypothetical protein
MSESTIQRSGRPRGASVLGAGLLLAAVAWTTTTALHAGAGSLGYDPASDPVRELQAAVEKAKTRNARILVVVGGEWCSWCHILDRFVKGNDEIKSLWERSFVTLKVHFDPSIPGTPGASRKETPTRRMIGSCFLPRTSGRPRRRC